MAIITKCEIKCPNTRVDVTHVRQGNRNSGQGGQKMCVEQIVHNIVFTY